MRPDDYPGEPLRRQGVLVGGRLIPVIGPPGADAGSPSGHIDSRPRRAGVVRGGSGRPKVLAVSMALRSWGAAGMEAREPMLAVGSNADPAVLSAKLRRRGASPVVPVVPIDVVGLGVGHSAHQSAGGYVPAAPFHAPEAVTRVVLLWVDRSQRHAIDRTEPNYRRRWLPSAGYRWRPADEGLPPPQWRPVTGYWVYESRWGVLAGASADPLPLTSQQAVRDVFRAAGGRPGDGAVGNPGRGAARRPHAPAAGWHLLSEGTPSPRRRRRTG